MQVTLYVRCLTCWTPAIIAVEVERHLPPAVTATCPACGADKLMATTGQIVATLTPAQVRHLHVAQKTRTRPNWEQLPLREVLVPKGASRFVQPPTGTGSPAPKGTLNTNGSGSTQPSQGHPRSDDSGR